MNLHLYLTRALALPAATLVLVCQSQARDESDEASLFMLPGVTVIGNQETIDLLPGSARYIDQRELERHSYDDINQVIRSVPGVYIRQEDGYGLFPNISLRGVSSMRSSKVTLMEDGVLTAPAAYSAPSAYYSPTAGRMSAFEILKGSSQILYGPHTTGGVINYLSTPIPAFQQGYAALSYGTDSDLRAHIWFGDSVELGSGAAFSYLLENYYRQVDGFKTIDGTQATPASSDTGFESNDPMLKLRFTTPENRHSLEAKVGYSNRDADETYLGLSEDDFREDPFRRYAASRFDNIDTRQFRSYLRHRFEITPELSLNTTAYYNTFDRAWYKLNDVRVSGDDDWRNLSEILAGGHGQSSLDLLRGDAAGELRVRNNNRSYYSKGLQSSLRLLLEQGELSHEIDLGVRFHRDAESRFQNQDVYTQNGQGGIDSVAVGAPGTQDNRTGEADATAIYLMDRITAGKWSVTPGLRYETVDFTNTRRNTALGPDFNSILPGSPVSKSTEAWTPGIGFTYGAGERVSYFGGVHRGISMPGPSEATASDPLTEETSLGYELGMRFQNQRAAWGEVAWFLTDFDDLIVPSNIGGGGGSTTSNVGEVRAWGFEALVGWDPARAADRSYRLPTTLTLTWTDATLRNDVNSDGSGGSAVESIFAGGRYGNRVPYIPEYQLNLATGFENDSFSVFLNAFYVDSVYATANNTDLQRRGENADGPLDSRFGKIDAHFLLDLAITYKLTDADSLRLNVDNLLDREYMASRVPHGPRPGKPRAVHLGYVRRF